MPKIILIQGSLRQNSRTAIVMNHVKEMCELWGIENELIDLRDYELPFCDGRSTAEYGEPVVSLHQKLLNADGYVISSPVYAYTYSGVVKNFLDIFGGAMKDKFSGAVYNAGGTNSYLASGELVKIMAFDFNHTVVQPTVYTHRKHFLDGKIDSDYVHEKIEQMLRALSNSLNIPVSVKLTS